MQYHIQTLVKHLFDKDSFEQVTVQELKQFTDDYPYAAVGQFLYAKKLKDSGSYSHYEQGEAASLYFNNALWLRYILDKKEEAPALPRHQDEQAQQPGFRILVQMPGIDQEEKKEESAVLSKAEGPAEIEGIETTPVVTGVEELNDPDGSHEEALAAEETITEAGTVPSAQIAEEAPAKPEEPTPAETEVASTVAIAEISQLAEESKAEAAVNAVSITEEALTTPAATTVQEAEQPVNTATTETLVTQEALTPPAAEEENIQPQEAAAAVTDVPVQSAEKVQQPAPEQAPAAQPVVFTPASQEAKTAVDPGEPIFESYHTIDYFASQGIKLQQEDFKDRLGKQLKSFTDWLRSMKRIGPIENSTSLDEITNQSIQRIAEHSVEEKEVVTEAMAEVWAKQGHTDKAIKVYEKLSLLNPSKSPYFAGRIEQLKAL